LLMLSGIGPRNALEHHGIGVRVDLPGVGLNLQDRYEIGVVNRMKREWDVLAGARFGKGDAQYRRWAIRREGVFATNGFVMSTIKRSARSRSVPDLFCFAMLTRFAGYYPNYSAEAARSLDCLTWAVLKGYTNNRAGEVTLHSADPRVAPRINFHYFDEGDPDHEEDLNAVVDGVRFVREIVKPLKGDLIAEEEVPGDRLQTDAQLKEFVRNHAWGHHASCTCPIGARDRGGVLTSDFRVHDTQGLRVVDASVFPRIPGLFLVSAVYMIAEKAADVILAAARCRPGLALHRHLRDQALDVRHDALTRRGVALAHRGNIPLIDTLAAGRGDIAAEAHDTRRALKVIQRDRPWTARR